MVRLRKVVVAPWDSGNVFFSFLQGSCGSSQASKDRWIQPAPTQGTPCFPQSLANARFSAPPVPGIPPCALYKQDNSMALPQSHAQLKFDFHPSKECIDAIIGDVLTKPLSPLPLGLKAPSPEGVLVELQRQGISKLPPTCAL